MRAGLEEGERGAYQAVLSKSMLEGKCFPEACRDS